ncbi:hypothetical protein DB88DRAFT_314338 [Papiliotrema laurentii]|uniref:Uncharacterized protein n=1 Tax=Papiliotrema laurentii TaxID=5418 RepID=A0AAD9CYJ9_PAPLA|nr:hypothetical protein DB88DRAFT_314338 [Papiliotrema laurentii]
MPHDQRQATMGVMYPQMRRLDTECSVAHALLILTLSDRADRMNYYQPDRQPNILAIIGGAIGGLIALAIVGYCSIALYIKRTLAKSAPSPAEERADRWLGNRLPSWTNRTPPAPSTIGSETVFSDDKGVYDGRSTVFSRDSILTDHAVPSPVPAAVISSAPPFPRANWSYTLDSPISSAGPATPTSPTWPLNWKSKSISPNAHVEDDSRGSSEQSGVGKK